MKKLFLALTALLMVTAVFAQKKNIQSASNSLRNKEYKEAVDFIELAIKDPSTSADPKAWYTRALIYAAMDQDPGYADKNYHVQAMESYMKVVELKPTYEPEQVTQGLLYSAYKFYNNSVLAYNKKQYDDAFSYAKHTVDIHNLEGGKRFAANKSFDTVAAQAMVIQAYSAFYGGKVEEAIPVLESLKSNPMEGNANLYLIIIDAYKKLGKQDKELATIEEAKKRFSSNPNIRNEELNFYMRTKQQDKLLQKLEAAVAEEPGNAMYQYNLANAYTTMAFPKEGASPSNYEELIAKAEAGFTKALEVEPDNMGYHYDMGVLYFNQATILTDKMNNISGTTAEDNKKWDAMNAQRNVFFDKSFPHLEKIAATLGPKMKELDADNMFIYQSSLAAMSQIYALQNKMDKVTELKKKIEEAKKVASGKM